MANYALGLYEKAMPGTMTLGQKLDCAKACGFDYMELSVDETDDKLARLAWTKQERRASSTPLLPVYELPHTTGDVPSPTAETGQFHEPTRRGGSLTRPYSLAAFRRRTDCHTSVRAGSQ